MNHKLRFVITTALIVLALDHLTKWLIVTYIPLGGEVTIIPHIFDIVHGRNTGAAFGMLSNWDSPFRDWFFYGMGGLALVFLYYYVKSTPQENKLAQLALGFILGGALGNITDRICRGSVVDFLSLHYDNQVKQFEIFDQILTIPLTWPAFNVADAAISTAVVILVIQGLKKPNLP